MNGTSILILEMKICKNRIGDGNAERISDENMQKKISDVEVVKYELYSKKWFFFLSSLDDSLKYFS